MEFHMLIGRIPAEVVRERPGLCLQNAWLCVLTGSIAAIPPLLEAAESGLTRAVTPEATVYRAFASVLRAYLRDLDNQPVALDPVLEQAYAAIPESNPGMRNSVGMILGMICFMEGDFTAARRYYDAALALDKRIGGTNAVPIAGMRIALLLRARGKLRETERLLRDAIEYTRQRGSRRFYICGVLNLMLAEVLLEWDRLEEAETEIRVGLRLLEDWPSVSMHGLGLALLARLRLARGESGPARAALEQIAEYARRTHFHPFFSDRVEHARVALLIACKDRAALEEWARANQDRLPAEFSFRSEARRIELCRVWLALGRTDLAAGLLEELAGAAAERAGSRLDILAMLAAAREDADTLETALRLGEPEGALRVFVEAGDPMRGLLGRWLKSPRAAAEPRLSAYARRILAVTSAVSAPSGLALAAELPEPLSPREREVLALAARGMTNAQIAARLVLSVRTVKKHIENIHGKLGVENRTQAAARARELGLLD
jgi:LuxR family maltose regulon positive regulatory protein